jgi:coenzyme F420-dependent glucose-6-phosphate dehydrogenase
LYLAAVGEEATKTAAKYTDGLITVSKPDKTKEIFDIFEKAAVEEGKDPRSLEKIAKPKISYSEDYDKALKSAEFWRASLLEDVFNLDISDPRELQQKAKDEVSDEKLKQSTLIITSKAYNGGHFLIHGFITGISLMMKALKMMFFYLVSL